MSVRQPAASTPTTRFAANTVRALPANGVDGGSSRFRTRAVRLLTGALGLLVLGAIALGALGVVVAVAAPDGRPAAHADIPTLSPHPALSAAALSAAADLRAAPLGAPSAASPLQGDGPPEVFVNTTEDLEVDPGHCRPGALCPMRSAVSIVADDGGTIRARFCGGGVEPPCLSVDDPNFDPITGKWYLQTTLGFGHTISGTNMTVDFARDLPGWSGPADNRIVLEALEGESGVPIDWALAIEGENGTLVGFDVEGIVQIGAVVLQRNATNTEVRGVAVHSLFEVRPGDAAAAFVLRGNLVSDNRLHGNWCGITGDGSVRAPVDGPCVVLERGANANVIGAGDATGSAGARNVFCAREVGIRMEGDGTRSNVVDGNDIGVTPSGEACGGGIGIHVRDQAHQTTIANNIVAGNAGDGIVFSGDVLDSAVEKNLIGFAGVRMPNGGFGINISGDVQRTRIAENVIAHNGGGGIRVNGSNTLQNIITRNSIFLHAGKPIDIDSRSNGGVDVPRLTSVSETQVIGIGCAGCLIEIFSDTDDEARVYEGSVELRSSGPFFFDKPEGLTHNGVTASATNPEFGTSELSAPLYVGGTTPEPSATPITLPTATTRPPEAVGRIHLPWSHRP